MGGSARDVAVMELRRQGSLTGHVIGSGDGSPYTVDAIVLELSGSLSKIPSVSNSRLVRAVPKKGYRHRHVSSVAEARKYFSVYTHKHPAYHVYQQALTQCYDQVFPVRVTLNDSHSRPVFVLVLLGDRCNRIDSHNTPKFVLDWMQTVGLLSNDRHADCLAISKRRLWSNNTPADTSIIHACVVDESRKGVLQSFIAAMSQGGGI